MNLRSSPRAFLALLFVDRTARQQGIAVETVDPENPVVNCGGVNNEALVYDLVRHHALTDAQSCIVSRPRIDVELAKKMGRFGQSLSVIPDRFGVTKEGVRKALAR